MKSSLIGLAIVVMVVAALAVMLNIPLNMVPFAILVTAVLLVTVLIIDGKIKVGGGLRVGEGGLRIRK